MFNRKAWFQLFSFVVLLIFSAVTEAKMTIITGSYAADRVKQARERLATPAFQVLGAHLIRTKSVQYVARISVGCFDSVEQSAFMRKKVLAAGAKGIWLAKVNRCDNSRRFNLPSDLQLSALGFILTEKPSLEKPLAAHVLEKQSKIDKPLLPVSDNVDKENAVKLQTSSTIKLSPESRVMAGRQTESAAIDTSGSLSQKNTFTPVRWDSKKAARVAFTSGENPTSFVDQNAGCREIKRISVKTLDGIVAPENLADYEFAGKLGNRCLRAFIYVLEGDENV